MPRLCRSGCVKGTALYCICYRHFEQLTTGLVCFRVTIPVVGQRQDLSGKLPEVVLLHIIAKRPETHTEKLRSFHLDPAGPIERLGEVGALYLFDV